MSTCKDCGSSYKRPENRNTGHICLNCWNARRRVEYHARIEKQRERGRDKYLRYAVRYRASSRNKAKEIKDTVIAHYGGKCGCCGEPNPKFLTIDHINNDGAMQRSGRGGQSRGIYAWIVRNGFPTTLRLLCYNCNCGRDKNGGICPHEEIHSPPSH